MPRLIEHQTTLRNPKPASSALAVAKASAKCRTNSLALTGVPPIHKLIPPSDATACPRTALSLATFSIFRYDRMQQPFQRKMRGVGIIPRGSRAGCIQPRRCPPDRVAYLVCLHEERTDAELWRNTEQETSGADKLMRECILNFARKSGDATDARQSVAAHAHTTPVHVCEFDMGHASFSVTSECTRNVARGRWENDYPAKVRCCSLRRI